MRLKLSCIEMDTSIQCRASIDTATVSEYAERMTEGDAFPPVIVYGTSGRCWIADGWHRIMAANQIGLLDIEATVTPGGRIDALKAALAANAAHGIRRTNQDKRRAVEIALREFGKLSSRQIAELCGVSTDMVIDHRPQLSESDSSKRMGADGKERPATRRTSLTVAVTEPVAPPVGKPVDEVDDGEGPVKSWTRDEAENLSTMADNAPAHEVKATKRPVGMTMAMEAINILRRIPEADPMRLAGLAEVAKYIKHTQKGTK